MRIDDVRDAVVSLEKRMDRGFEKMDSRLDRMNGLMIAMLLAIVGGMSAILAVMLQR